LLGGVIFIHEKGECHRDLKPENSNPFICQAYSLVLFSVKHRAWKITDFGLTTQSTSTKVESSKDGMGTTGYPAPELVAEFPKFTKSSDIFSLGCIIYELLFDHKLFPSTYKVFTYRYTRVLPPFPSIQTSVGQAQFLKLVLSSMLELDWRKRPAAREVARALEGFPTEPVQVFYAGSVEEIYRESPTASSVSLSAADPQWSNVDWQPYWYGFYLFPVLTI
jgi:serine/threonine protein kinase